MRLIIFQLTENKTADFSPSTEKKGPLKSLQSENPL